MIARGSSDFTTPYVDGSYDSYNFKDREIVVTFIYDKSLPLDRMVVTRTTVYLENGLSYEDPSTAGVVHDGAPIDIYTETEFKYGIVEYIFHVVII